MSDVEAVTKPYIKPAILPEYGSLSSILKTIQPGEVVLDVGCAEGYLAEYLPDNKVWGIDGNSAAVKKAASRCVAARTVDLNDIPPKPVFTQKFDVIVFADVLEHLLYPTEVLQHFAAYLKPGGKIVISVPNIGLWRVRLNLLLGRFDYTDYGVLDRTHVHLYTFKTAQKLVRESGLSVSSIQGAANLLGPVVHYLPFLRGLLGIQIIVTARK